MARGALGLLLAAALLEVARAAVHPYSGEYFYSVGDAFIFRGGREGMFESKSEVGLAALTHQPPAQGHASVCNLCTAFRWRRPCVALEAARRSHPNGRFPSSLEKQQGC
jgi:hypothetical protein